MKNSKNTKQLLILWVVYFNPSDFPGKWVVRKWILDQPTHEHFLADSLEGIRSAIPKGLYRIEREPGDDAVIIETWL